MKIKTAARLPKNWMTSPIFGMRIAQTSDVANHGVAIQIRRFKLVSVTTPNPTTSPGDRSTSGWGEMTKLKSLITLQTK